MLICFVIIFEKILTSYILSFYLPTNKRCRNILPKLKKDIISGIEFITALTISDLQNAKVMEIENNTIVGVLVSTTKKDLVTCRHERDVNVVMQIAFKCSSH